MRPPNRSKLNATEKKLRLAQERFARERSALEHKLAAIQEQLSELTKAQKEKLDQLTEERNREAETYNFAADRWRDDRGQ